MNNEPITKARRELFGYLQRAMEERGLSVATVSKETGLDNDTINKLMTGDGSPTLDQVLSLCLALDVDISLNAAVKHEDDEEMPEVMLCEEPVTDSDIYLLHTKQPRSLWLCEVMDEDEAPEEEDLTVEFKTLDGYQETWRITPTTLFEATTEEEIEKASERCSKYLQAYLSWEDEDLRQSEGGTFN